MNLVYIDESGNSGLNLKDPQQPVFLMAALILHSSKWFSLEKDFYNILEKYMDSGKTRRIELHAIDLKTRRKGFAKITPEESIKIRNEMLQLLLDYEIPVVYRRIIKTQFAQFCEEKYGPGIKINPYIMALPFVCMEVNHYLRQKGSDELGMFIFDEQKEALDDTDGRAVAPRFPQLRGVRACGRGPQPGAGDRGPEDGAPVGGLWRSGPGCV